jgi:SAM-dependent methyltransferase
MGLKQHYEERVLPVVIDKICGSKGFAPHRRATLAGTHGTVLEIGFGSGTNLAHYPPEVERLLAVEPAGRAVDLAAERIARARFPVEVIGLDGEHLPLDAASVDCVVSTFTLCTVPNVEQALVEIRRVLRPGGTLHVLEHGLDDAADVQRWQRRLDPVQHALAGGCHLTRHIPSLVESTGLRWGELHRWREGHPYTYTSLTRGVAVVA